MLRALVCSLAVFAFLGSPLVAAYKKTDESRIRNEHRATYVKADFSKNMITFKMKGANGKEVEMTLPLAKDAKVLGTDNKPEKLETFVKNLGKEKNKSVWILEDKEGKHIVEVRDLAKK
jgi:hypothetical protein